MNVSIYTGDGIVGESGFSKRGREQENTVVPPKRSRLSPIQLDVIPTLDLILDYFSLLCSVCILSGM